MDVTLQGANTANWNLGSSVGANVFAMRAIFCAAGTTAIVEDSFKTEDSLYTATLEGDNTRFYMTNCGSGADGDGLDIAAGDSLGLYLWFQAPTTSNTTAQQSIVVTVGGKVAD